MRAPAPKAAACLDSRSNLLVAPPRKLVNLRRPMKKALLFLTFAILAAVATPAPAAQLLESGSFESPRVKERTPKNKGGSPIRASNSDWVQFDDKVDEVDGKLKAGITNEMAHTGKQALYIEYEKLGTDKAAVTLTSDMVSIMPDKEYRVSIWGRLPRRKPLTIDQRLGYLKLFVEFFKADRETPCEEGEAITMRAQPMPGSKNRPAMFTDSKWTEYYSKIESPKDAAFMRVRWQWDSPAQEGTTSGTIFFDDATIIGEPGPKPPETEPLDPEKMDDEGNFPNTAKAQPAPGTTATTPPAPGAPAPATPASATPKPKKP
jgi:hypothetical protein